MLTRKQSTTNILLFGLTSLEQLSASVVPHKYFIRVIIKVPSIMLSSALNGVLVGSKQGGFFRTGKAVISSRITCANMKSLNTKNNLMGIRLLLKL